jgi:hypothetical protein
MVRNSVPDILKIQLNEINNKKTKFSDRQFNTCNVILCVILLELTHIFHRLVQNCHCTSEI